MKIISLTIVANSGAVVAHTKESTATPFSIRFDEIGSFTPSTPEGLIARCESIINARVEAVADTLPAKLAELADVEAQLTSKRASLASITLAASERAALPSKVSQ